jgi:thioredoxin-related protein
MKKLCVFIIAGIVIFSSSFDVNAQKSEFYENNIWYLDKQTVIDSALSQQKQIFICYGRETCGYTTNVRRLLGTGQLKKLVDSAYVLWYVETLFGDDTKEYFYEYFREGLNTEDTLRIALPVICIVSQYDIHKSYNVSTGPKDERELINILDNDHVINEKITNVKTDAKVFFSGSRLVVNSAKVNETISVYSIVGSLVDKFKKTDQYVARDALSYPLGIFIVSSSSGWAKKVVKRE